MIILDNVTVGDNFPNENAQQPAAIMFPAVKSNGGYFTISNNPVYVQLAYNIGAAGYGHGQSRWTKSIPFPIGPGILLPGTVGIRFQNYTPGKAALVSGALAEEAEPSIEVTSSGTAGASGSLSVNYDTVLPATPTDGQISVLVDSKTAPTYIWMFRYNAGSGSTYKWECIGGTPYFAEVQTAEAVNSAVYTNLTTIGPQLASVPYDGEYEISFGAQMTPAQQNTFDLYMSIKFSAAAAVDADDIRAFSVGTGPNQQIVVSGARTLKKTVLSGNAILAQYKSPNGNSQTIGNRFLTVMPVRVL